MAAKRGRHANRSPEVLLETLREHKKAGRSVPLALLREVNRVLSRSNVKQVVSPTRDPEAQRVDAAIKYREERVGWLRKAIREARLEREGVGKGGYPLARPENIELLEAKLELALRQIDELRNIDPGALDDWFDRNPGWKTKRGECDLD